MAKLVLSDDQARIVTGATGYVELLDQRGRILALVRPEDKRLAETLRECKRRHATPGPRIPSEQVQAHMRRLEQIRASEGMDEPKMLYLLSRMQRGEKV